MEKDIIKCHKCKHFCIFEYFEACAKGHWEGEPLPGFVDPDCKDFKEKQEYKMQLTVSQVIFQLTEFMREHGDMPCYINTNDNAYNIIPLKQEHIEHIDLGMASSFSIDDIPGNHDDLICYLGEL